MGNVYKKSKTQIFVKNILECHDLAFNDIKRCDLSQKSFFLKKV